jgi:DNA replication protein DnaC
MEAGTSRDNMPISSTTDEDVDSPVCRLCGRQSICGGTGVVRYEVPVEDARFGKLFHCPNYRLNLDSDRQEKLRLVSNLHVFADKTFEAFATRHQHWTPVQQSSVSNALNIAYNYAERPEGWLLLEGTYGCGKTHLAAAIGNHRLAKGDGVLFITTPDLLDHLRGTYGPNSEIGYDDTFDRVRNAPMLILDDLGVENPSHWAQEKLFQLLNHRYSRQMPTVITTNADLDLLDLRIRSRLLDVTFISRVRILAPDYRSGIYNQRDQLSNLLLYGEMQFENFDTTTQASPEDRMNLERGLEVAQNFARDLDGWLLFTGKVASGKTHLAAAIANDCQRRGIEVVFVTVADLLDYLRMTFNPGSTSTYEGRFQTVRNAMLLVLDDLGTESATPWAKEKLFQIINHRYISSTPTIFTTSKPLPDIDERIRYRLLDKRRCKVYAITAQPFVTRKFGR